MKLKKMINVGMLALGLTGAVAASTPASALGNLLPLSGLSSGGGLLSFTSGGLTVSGGIIFGAPLWSVGMDFQGWITMLTADGHVFKNLNFANEPTFHGWRSPVKGHMVMEMGSDGLHGNATFEPFMFANSLASGRDITFYSPNALLNLVPTNTYLLGNMLFDYGDPATNPNAIKGIPVSIVLDIGGLTTALKNTAKGQILKGLLTAASEGTLVDDGSGPHGIPMGPVLVATTTLNTTDVDTDGDGQPGPIKLGTNPSGTTPLLVDTVVDATNGQIGIGGSPIKKSAFATFNPNFDFTQATVTCFTVASSCNAGGIPIPPYPLSAQPFAPLIQFIPQ